MKKILIMLMFPMFVHAGSVETVEMGLSFAPYVSLIDEDDKLNKAGAIFGTHLIGTGLWFFNRHHAEAWTLTSSTNAALLCTIEERDICAMGIISAGYVAWKRYNPKKKNHTAWGLTLGIIGGHYAPTLFTTF